MGFKVYKEEVKKKDTLLKLRSTNNNSVELIAVDKNGTELTDGNILEITSEGKIFRQIDCCAPGIKTDRDGRIIIINLLNEK